MCEKADFTHGPTIPYAKPRVLLTTQPKLVFLCVKTPLLLTSNWLRVWKGRFYSRQVNLVCEIPCFTHDPGKNEVAIHSTSCEPFHRASPSATEVPLEPYSTLNRMTKSHFPHEIMKSAYVKWPVLLTANESRVWKGHFYTRQVNLVCKTPCFTHGPDQNSVPVCKNPTFTHDKLAPCVKRPILLTGWYNWFQLTQFCPRNRGFLWTKWSEMQFCPRNCRFLWIKRVVAV